MGYLINADGKIASVLTLGEEPLLALAAVKPELRNANSETDQNLLAPAAANRPGNRSPARSKIKRDGLKAGTPATEFRLPRLDGHASISANYNKAGITLGKCSFEAHCIAQRSSLSLH